tara:strand:- start:27 stop:458 length:432 start_codon:yes stop_codon:yes gene_type:complete
MIIPCRKCGKLGERPNASNIKDMTCSFCGALTMKKETGKIITSCEECDLAQQIPINQYSYWRCKSCGAKQNHPIKKPINGAGYGFDVEFTKTTINLPDDLLEAIDDHLVEVNHYEGQKKLKPPKVKRGQFIRMLLKQHFGFKQ